MGLYRNIEGYSDPTAGAAYSNIAIEKKKKQDAERLDKIRVLLPILRATAELAGFKIDGRIILIDIKTGKKYE